LARVVTTFLSKKEDLYESLSKVSMTVVVLMVFLFVTAFYGAPAFGQQKYVLKFNHVLGQKNLITRIYELGKACWRENKRAVLD